MPSFRELLTQHVATGVARQLALGELLGERNWQLSTSQGVAGFGDDLHFPVQLLGSESEAGQTWLWAWANEQSNLPPAVLHLCGWLYEYGRNAGVAEFVEPELRLARANGQELALVASGLTGRCYYRGPYDGGAVFFHLENVPAQVLAPVAPERALTVMTRVIQTFEVDHRGAVLAFLQQQGWQVEATARRVTGRHASGSDLSIGFDDDGRIDDIEGQVRSGG